ncbi:ABC transporter ATP-binding protein [Rhodococcus sp. WS1]|uniref:ABC transporter ATP-binding protein n=1 Tax=unclassified Rhodococcus (in: high G+C Gram-positive bacteria) TaxID=192944 RepID=UPI001142B26C|nr:MULTISPECIES: ABC transporter ATP-binding protein [unclassified Rhodococcus (in: high G+C Gram-positive bacteria)]ROZ53029.1 ABC transporter ATP-binding protein [Rhodococcus sp. WS1]TQC36038.1 ABC transporter ATP-binding protein [Rhodococcus sp. WS7]
MSILLTAEAEPETVLRVADLRIVNEVDEVVLVGGVDFELRRGEVLGIVGESGSGKSISLRAVLGLLPAGLAISGGTIELFGSDTSRFTNVDWNRARGSGITAVFQDPGSYLNPSIPVGKQVVEVLRVKRGLGRREAKAQALTLLDEVRIHDPALVFRQYPHELSGGMLQRVLLAIAVSLEPRILIADEATTALDVTVQAEVLDLIVDLTERHGLSLIVVSHDLAVVAQVADEVVVFRDGVIVERGSTAQVLHDPQHEYTRLLVSEHELYGLDRFTREVAAHVS